MSVLLGKMAWPVFALCLLVLGASPINGAERLKVFTSEVPPIAQDDPARPGFAVELVKAVLREVRLDGEVVFVPWARLVESGGSPTGTLAFPVPRLANLQSDFTWIAPLVDLDLSFVSTGQEVNSLAQALELRSILVRGRSVYEYMLRDYGFGNVVPVSSGNIPLMLAKGRADAWFTTTDEARWAWSAGQTATPLDAPMKLGKPIGEQRMWLAGSKGLDRGIAERIARVVAAMREDGRFNAIMAAYLSPRPTAASAAIRVAAVKNREIVNLQSSIKDFEASHPGVSVEIFLLPEGELRDAIAADVFSGSGRYDVIAIGTYETPIWAKKGWLRPIVEFPASYDVDDLMPSVKAALSYENRLYALPFYAESSVTYVRKDLLAKAGASLPANPTYQDILAAARAMHDPAGGIFGACLRGKPGWGESVALISTIVNGHGGRWFDESWRPQIDTREWKAALLWYRAMLKDFGPPNAAELNYNGNLALFTQGKCGLWIDATVAAGTLFDPTMSSVATKVGLAAAPHGASDRGTQWLWSWAFAIPSTSQKFPEALRFIQWATSKSYIQAVGERLGWVVAPPGTRQSTYRDPRYRASAPFADAVRDAIMQADPNRPTQHAVPYKGIQYVAIPEFQAIGTRVGQEIARFLTGHTTIDDVLFRANTATAEIMKAASYYK
jgi:sorbitol/mannitol transport system substrate-binding protein